MRSFCSNPWLFKKQYILGIWDFKATPAMVTGSAFHKFAENFHSGMDQTNATKKAYELVSSKPDSEIEWGKTGSREKILKDLNTVIDIYLSQAPDFGETVSTEYKQVVLPKIDGKPWPLPVKAVTDRITKQADGLHLIDYKVVSSLSDPAEEKPDYIMQAMFNYFTVSETMPEEVIDMTYFEIKKSISRNGDPQTQAYTIEFKKHAEYFKYFGKMYAGVLEQLANPEFQFLPNFSDFLGAKEAWTDFTSEVMDFNMPAQVVHRSATTQNVDRSFVESKLNETENVPTTPQDKIVTKMMEFGVPLEYVENYPGANVTMYAFKPSRGVKMTTIEKFDRDLQLALETTSVRILAPIPGKKLVGVEIPSEQQIVVPLADAPAPKTALELPIGIDIYGKAHTLNLAKAPHLLVAGATGAGKSVALATFIKALTTHNMPIDLGLVLIDPKRSEFSEYQESQHLLADIITEVDDAGMTLEWAVEEMESRYQVLQKAKVKNIDAYRSQGGHMQYVVIVIDELADLMLSRAPKKRSSQDEPDEPDFEKALIRLAQKARAVGIHLIVATQRPSVDVVTGILKANFPTRLAFMTVTQMDSKVILDQGGAEKLIGNGDCMLMQPRADLVRLQGYFTE